MPAPIIASVAIQTGFAVLKKHPWIIIVLIAIILLPIILVTGVIFGGIGAAGQLTKPQAAACSKTYTDTVDQLFGNDKIRSSQLSEKCPPAGPGGPGTEFGDVDDSAFSTVGTTVSPEVQKLAQALMDDFNNGRLTSGYFGGANDHIKEIQYLANGQAVIGCGVDYRVLQIIKIAVDMFGTAGVSDINRRCTGQIEGAGVNSAHYANGGGHAVDFYQLGGSGLTGADGNSMNYLSVLDSRVPHNTYVGQSTCGRGGVTYNNFYQFEDGCNHLHIDFRAAEPVAVK